MILSFPLNGQINLFFLIFCFITAIMSTLGYTYNDKCAVTIFGNSILNGCNAAPCSLPLLTQKTCCCDSSYCNDEAFVEKCKARYATANTKGITCHSLLPHIDEQKCSGKQNFFKIYKHNLIN